MICARPIRFLGRHVADLAEHPAVGRVVAVVAHHEIVAGRHGIDRRVVVEAVIGEIERGVAHAIRQGFAKLLDALHDAVVVGDEIVDALARHRLAVDVEHAVDHLDAVARQPDHTLDVIDRVVLGQPEHHDVAALRLRGQETAGKERRRERERVVRIAVGIFRYEQIIADQQCRDHRAGRDIERLKQESADHQRDDQGVEHHADRFRRIRPLSAWSLSARSSACRLANHAPARDLCSRCTTHKQLRAGIGRGFRKCRFYIVISCSYWRRIGHDEFFIAAARAAWRPSAAAAQSRPIDAPPPK